MRIGLFGFGRIGRNLFRLLYNRDDIQLAAISDPADHGALEYLARFDTILGRFPGELSVKEGNLYAHGRQIPMLSERDPGAVDWSQYDVDVVVEASGQQRTREEMERHLEAGAKRVVLCVPPLDAPDITVVMGLNDGNLRREHQIISNASCTAHCAGPVLKILQEAFGIERAFCTTVHAYTNEQRLADVPAKDPRRGRAAAENIIPQETEASTVLEGVIPALQGRTSCKAINVPVANGSVVDLVCWHERPVTVTAINEVIRTAAGDRFPGILDFEDEPIVSSDIVHSPFSSTFDSLATMTLGERVSKTLAWYDNSWGYSHRVIDLVQRIGEIDGQEAA